MEALYCPACHAALEDGACYCARCGTALSSGRDNAYETQKTLLSAAGHGSPETLAANPPADTTPASSPLINNELQGSRRPASLKIPHFYPLGGLVGDTTQPVNRTSRPATINTRAGRKDRFMASLPTPVSQTLPAFPAEEEQHESGTTSAFLRERQQVTWHKDVEPERPRALIEPVAFPVRPPTSSLPVRMQKQRRPPPSLFFWVSMLVMFMLVLGGVFGIFVTWGRSLINAPDAHEMSLQVTPATLAIGATMTLRGSNFSPHGRIGLTRDSAIPLLDTGGLSIISTDTQGNFTDTVTVTPDWGAGQHVINAEDALKHKIAQFPVTVTGKDVSLRPAHLQIEPTAIDLGAGDQATNSTQIVTLNNLGGGQISWQASVTQSWLQVTPIKGTFSNAQRAQITVAANRFGLKAGDYHTSLMLASNAGDSIIPITMRVLPLQLNHEAVLEATPIALNFTATDGGGAPAAQSFTINNPGAMPLQWSASSSSNWLSFTPQTGSVASNASQDVAVNVDISTLLPGTYNGVITLNGQGDNPVQGSPQNIYVSVTILPQCAIQIAPGGLTFSGVAQQPSPPAKTISVGLSQSCSSAIQWSASSNANWLLISATSGTAPSTPAVSVNTAGLGAGTYNGALTFSSVTGTQTLPVSLTVQQATQVIPAQLATAPTSLTFTGTIGQPAPVAQVLTVTNAGGGPLTWQAAAVTTVGGNWLTLTPATGTLAANKAAPVSVTVTPLATLVAGTYTGTITVTATDAAGKAVGGSPQSIPVTFTLQAACVATVTPASLTFTSSVGQTAPTAQPLTIAASSTCANTLNWTATVSTTPAGGTWLTATPATGTVTVATNATTSVGVTLTGLAAGTYTGTVTVAATDSVTKLPVGTPQAIPVTLTVQPACALQAASTAQLTFSAEAGTNPATQTFTIGTTGSCTGNVVLTPTVTLNSGTGWLAMTPNAATLPAGTTATFTATVTSAALVAGTYNATVSVAATSGGVAIGGSPQTVAITLTVGAAPALTVAPASLTINATTGTSSTPLTVSNSGGAALNWTAALASGAPSFVSLSAASGTNLAGGANVTVTVVVNASGLAGGSTYNTSVNVSALDPVTGKPVAGSPINVPITIVITPPAMQLSTTSLTFNATVGNNPAAQAIVVTNTGGDGLSWTVGTPSASWLTVTPTSGTDASGATSNVTFNVNTTGLTAGKYSATVVITPSAGSATTITITLTIA